MYEYPCTGYKHYWLGTFILLPTPPFPSTLVADNIHDNPRNALQCDEDMDPQRPSLTETLVENYPLDIESKEKGIDDNGACIKYHDNVVLVDWDGPDDPLNTKK
jgi:hypothetical protein